MTSHPKTLRLNELTRSVHFTKAPRDLPPSGQSKGKEEGGMRDPQQRINALNLANAERRDEVLASAAKARKSLGHEVCG
jgi:hypothetical protein